MRVALVHDWLIHMRGGEKVLEALAEMFPEATIYTLFACREKLSPSLQRMKIRTSFLQSIPGLRKFYRWLLPLFPWAIRTLKIEGADFVISTSHCVAKAVTVPRGAYHISYIHTPMRYLWGFREDYFGKFPWLLRWMIEGFLDGLRRWDRKMNRSVDAFIANSRNVQERIKAYYGRDSHVIYPPLDDGLFRLSGTAKGDYYLIVSAFVPYKRVDLAIEAFNGLGRNLIVVGDGPLAKAYHKLRRGNPISFVGSVSGKELCKLYGGAKALIFPTEEDFGIVPCEAQACGTPVIAYAKGGALETVREGVFFHEQTPKALADAVLEFEKRSFDAKKIAASVESFGRENFKRHIRDFIRQCRERSGIRDDR